MGAVEATIMAMADEQLTALGAGSVSSVRTGSRTP
jgi:hypothetical protein